MKWLTLSMLDFICKHKHLDVEVFRNGDILLIYPIHRGLTRSNYTLIMMDYYDMYSLRYILNKISKNGGMI